MSNQSQPDPVQPAVRHAANEAARHLEEACDEIGAKDLSRESLEELLRIEDELLAAARAVDETVRLRRQLADRTTSTVAMQPPQDVPVCRLRDFHDTEGREWRAWEVRPGSTGRRINPERYLGEYVKGWLAFECPQNEIRKRLPNHPTDWFDMSDGDLSQLLPRALDVVRRAPGSSPPAQAG